MAKTTTAKKQTKPPPGTYTLTARYRGRWRWALVGDHKTDRIAINRAKKILEAKVSIEADPDDPEFDQEGLDIWTHGGITLANSTGHIIWDVPMKIGA